LENLTTSPTIHGYCAPAFQAVADEFTAMLEIGDDNGCSFSAYSKGEKVVSLWGGFTDPDNTLPWQENTLACTFSACKPFTAVLALQLCEQGLLDLQKPIAHYWPEFGANGKGDITASHVLSHTCGLPAFKHAILDEDLYRWDNMVKHVEQMEPWWPAGEKQAYKPFTYGWILGGLIQRITGATPAELIQSRITKPLNIDAHIGLSPDDHARCATLQKLEVKKIKPSKPTDSSAQTKKPKPEIDVESLFYKAFNNPKSMAYGSNSTAWRSAQIPAANGHCTAEALAKFYSDLVSKESLLLQQKSRDLFSTLVTEQADQTIFFPMAFSTGMFLSTATSTAKFGREPGCFGHPGAGGSVAFADPKHELSVAFVTRNMGVGLMGDKRLQRMSKALYDIL
jgi:CubicO group peptidase (beta-lactamase class C family)